MGMPRSPKTSLIAHAKTSSPTDGFNEFNACKGHMSFKSEDGLMNEFIDEFMNVYQS